jgi:hypothetical protein
MQEGIPTLHIHLLGGFQLVSGEAQLITQELEAG